MQLWAHPPTSLLDIRPLWFLSEKLEEKVGDIRPLWFLSEKLEEAVSPLQILLGSLKKGVRAQVNV